MKRRQVQLSLVPALLVILLFWFLQIYGKEQLTTNHGVTSNLHELDRLDSYVINEFLQLELSNFPNYDQVNNLILQRKGQMKGLLTNSQLSTNHHSDALGELRKWEEMHHIQVGLLRKWQSMHSVLRNSAIYLPTLAQQIVAMEQDFQKSNLMQILLDLETQSALSQSYRSSQGLAEIQKNIDLLRNIKAKDVNAAMALQNLIDHGEVFIKVYPQYLELRDSLIELNNDINSQRSKTVAQFLKEDISEVNFLIKLSYMIFLFILLAEILVIVYLRRAEKALVTDPLTGLTNRLGFLNRVADLTQGGFLLINIRKFNRVNSFFSTAAGDLVLRGIAQRLQKIPAPGLEAFRLGGDEFGLLLPELTGPDELEQYSQKVIETLQNQAFEFEGLPIYIEPAIAGTLNRPFLTKANMVLSEIKQNSRLQNLNYTSELGLEEGVKVKSAMLQQLRKAIEEDRIIPFFQPIVDLKTDKIIKYECLIRLKQEDGRILTPYFFLELAKEANYYVTLTKIMVEKSFAAFADSDMEFSLNLSAEDMGDDELADWLIAKLEAHPQIAKRVTFELLESEGIDNFDVIINFISRIKSYGCTLAIDDFGSGYSNYENILKLGVDYLKIDGSLIKNVDTDQNSALITESIIAFAHKMGLLVVVEFVHSQSVLDRVRELDADFAQGFFLGEPAPFE